MSIHSTGLSAWESELSAWKEDIELLAWGQDGRSLIPNSWGARLDNSSKSMEYLVPLGILALWIVLQVWVLPRFGVKT